MGVVRRLAGRARSAIGWAPKTAWSWWTHLEPSERVLYRAVVLSAVGFGMVAVPLAFIVPAVLFALVFFGFSLRRA